MGVLPVVMGAPRGDYARLAPPHSFVHVEDFADVLQLAQYLMLLDANASLYSACVSTSIFVLFFLLSKPNLIILKKEIRVLKNRIFKKLKSCFVAVSGVSQFGAN